MVGKQVDRILDMVDVQHNSGVSRACPAWVCEEQIEWIKIKEKCYDLMNDLELISLEESKEKEMDSNEKEDLYNEMEIEDDQDYEMKMEENIRKTI
jgi:hypothetical protein